MVVILKIIAFILAFQKVPLPLFFLACFSILKAKCYCQYASYCRLSVMLYSYNYDSYTVKPRFTRVRQ